MSFEKYCDEMLQNRIVSCKTRFRDIFYSETAIKNKIDNRIKEGNQDIWDNIAKMCPVIEEVNQIIYPEKALISSWYRSPKLNSLVSKSKTSKHQIGTCVDFVTGDVEDTYKKLAKELTKFTKIIFETSKKMKDGKLEIKTWIHLEYNGENSRIAFELQV